MPVATAVIVAGVAYQAQKKYRKTHSKQDGDGDSDSKGDGSKGGLSIPSLSDIGGRLPTITPVFLKNKTSIGLLPLEQSLAVLDNPISAVSFYQCTSAESANATIETLESRVHAILKANPWLGGWLVQGLGAGALDKTPRLWYDPTGKDMAPTIFQKLSHRHVPLDKDTPYPEYESILLSESALSATVKTNPQIVNRKEEPSFRITVIIPSSDEGAEFALIQSMSHVCGDGHTFYRIHNMLLGNEPIVSLTPKREQAYTKKVMQLMGNKESHYISKITSDPGWMDLFKLPGKKDNGRVEEEDGSELQGKIFSVNREWIGNIKASFVTEGGSVDVGKSTLRSPMDLNSSQGPTQSTNDILVSWFWSLVNPDVGLMAVNFRNRVDIVTDDHAGNYTNPIPFTPEDYKTAALIRQSLESCRRAGMAEGAAGVPTELPKANPDLTFSIISNWSSFHPAARGVRPSEVEHEDWPEGVELVRHVPIVHPKQMMKSMPRGMSFMIIFSSRPEDIGCMLIAPRRVMEEIDRCGVVKEDIAQI